MWVQSLGWEDSLEEGITTHINNNLTKMQNVSKLKTYVCVCVCMYVSMYIYMKEILSTMMSQKEIKANQQQTEYIECDQLFRQPLVIPSVFTVSVPLGSLSLLSLLLSLFPYT